MADYLVRVELHGANELDYAHLHVQMALLGFYRQIPATTGGSYPLPTGLYWGQSELGGSGVVDFVHAACDLIGKPCEIVATRSAETWFFGL
ncbi:hypothetical protein [Burkholderia sp. LA-2-3-30-S1-D2]|uniref:hypothetical protein n=1 Tax=Burkholderia sp. LA-2-3-30-S1-D2 TaxID=1637862 RepID=UPI000A879EE9|nr:hypothetical protein [Burkholderia sp. LA-2-3-30-S1-D2]